MSSPAHFIKPRESARCASCGGTFDRQVGTVRYTQIIALAAAIGAADAVAAQPDRKSRRAAARACLGALRAFLTAGG